MTHHERDKLSQRGKPIVCSACGLPGGTLVKIDDHYEHRDKAKCRMMHLRKGGKA